MQISSPLGGYPCLTDTIYPSGSGSGFNCIVFYCISYVHEWQDNQNCDLSRSSKNGCWRAALAEMRFAGLNCNILERRSTPCGSKSGTTREILCGCQRGYSCQSLSLLTPGQTSSVGVPRSLKMWSNCWSSESPGNRGDLRDNSANMHPTDHMSTGVE